MDDKKEDGRYYPDEREQQILISQLKVYFAQRERSTERKNICLQTCKLLQKEKGGNHWTERTTRLWFNNNKSNYLPQNSQSEQDNEQNNPQKNSVDTINNQNNVSPNSFVPANLPNISNSSSRTNSFPASNQTNSSVYNPLFIPNQFNSSHLTPLVPPNQPNNSPFPSYLPPNQPSNSQVNFFIQPAQPNISQGNSFDQSNSQKSVIFNFNPISTSSNSNLPNSNSSGEISAFNSQSNFFSTTPPLSFFSSDSGQSLINSPMNISANISTDESTSGSSSRPSSTTFDYRSYLDYSSSISRSETPEILRDSIIFKGLEIPPLPKVNLSEYDPMKHQHYQYLQFLYNILRDASSLPPEERHQKQIEVEKAFGDCLRQFHDDLGITRVLSNDPTAKKTIQALQPTNHPNFSPPRYPSITSTIYAGIRSPPKTTSHIMTSPDIYFPSTVHLPDASPGHQSLFRGESQTTLFDLPGLVSSYCFDDDGTLFYTTIDEGAYYLHAINSNPDLYPQYADGAIHVNTGFFSPPLAIVASQSTVYVAGDCRIFGFNKETFEKVDVMFISNTICPTFSLALSSLPPLLPTPTTSSNINNNSSNNNNTSNNDNNESNNNPSNDDESNFANNDEGIYNYNENELICASNGFIYIFNTQEAMVMEDNKKNPIKSPENQKIALQNGIKDVDWSMGRKYDEKIAVLEEVKEDTEVIPAGTDYFCVSSSKHHAIHVIDKQTKETVARLVGHTGVITVLANDDQVPERGRILSGSDDATVREWELENMRIEKVFVGYGETILAITTGEWEGASIMFSSDGTLIRAWSEDNNLPLFEVRLSDKRALSLKFVPNEKALLALCETFSPSSDPKPNPFVLHRYSFL